MQATHGTGQSMHTHGCRPLNPHVGIGIQHGRPGKPTKPAYDKHQIRPTLEQDVFKPTVPAREPKEGVAGPKDEGIKNQMLWRAESLIKQILESAKQAGDAKDGAL